MGMTQIEYVHRAGVVDAYLGDGRLIGTMRRVTKTNGGNWSGWLFEAYGGDSEGLIGATKADALRDFAAALADGHTFIRCFGDEDLFPNENREAARR